MSPANPNDPFSDPFAALESQRTFVMPTPGARAAGTAAAGRPAVVAGRAAAGRAVEGAVAVLASASPNRFLASSSALRLASSSCR